MTGSTKQVSTSSTKSSSPEVNAAISKLASGISAEYQPGRSLYQAPGATTQQGWASSLGAAGNADFSNGIAGALGVYGNRAAGGELGNEAPGYAALRSKLSDDVMRTTNTAFNNSGLFGSDTNQKSAAEGLSNALGGLDYQQYQNSLDRQGEATGMLSQLFAAGQMPGAVQQSVGGAQDASAQAAANGQTDYLARMTALLGGVSGAAGTDTTSTTPGPSLLQQLLGAGAIGAGIFGNVAGGMKDLR